MSNPHVFLDISIADKPAGRLVIELYADVVPKTVENFRLLCTGERGVGEKTGAPLHYKGTEFHRINKGESAAGGDIENKKGLGGESVYGGLFEDENFRLKHTERGLLSMQSWGPFDANGSTFCITFGRLYHLNGGQVVFGKVVKGMEVVDKIEEVGQPNKELYDDSKASIKDCGKPTKKVVIADCGELSESDIYNLMDSLEGNKENTRKRAISSDESSDGQVKKQLVTHGNDD